MQLIYSKQNLEFIVMQKIIYDENSQAENWIMHNIHYWSNVAGVGKIGLFLKEVHTKAAFIRFKKHSTTVIILQFKISVLYFNIF